MRILPVQLTDLKPSLRDDWYGIAAARFIIGRLQVSIIYGGQWVALDHMLHTLDLHRQFIAVVIITMRYENPRERRASVMLHAG